MSINTRVLMMAAAVFNGAAGVAASFLPDEIVHLAGSGANPLLAGIIQLAGALYLGFAMADWMARENLIGGIYGRPLLIANVVHFTVGALALGKIVLRGGLPQPALLLPIVYAVFAVAFGFALFGSPVKPATAV